MDKQLEAKRIVENAEAKIKTSFSKIEETALYNQKKVLDAFKDCKIALMHFNNTSGYGYDDVGRDTLSQLFAKIFKTEAALVSPHIMSGTHAISLALFGVLRPNDLIFSITGSPYDTLTEVIGGSGGSLKDFGIDFKKIELKNKCIDETLAFDFVSANKPKMVYMQRSRGYEWRDAISADKLNDVIRKMRKLSPNTLFMVDNCYGEFVEKNEPSEADLMAGSLIKNAGGGIAETGGYICGRKDLIELVANRFTTCSVGAEIGSYALGYRTLYQGVFLSPHAVSQSLKGSQLIGQVMSDLGYETMPIPNSDCYDITRSIKFNTEKELISFIQSIQEGSPIDSYVTLEPWDMPGYDSKVIMAAGCFIQGASLELSADSPIKEPYIAYIQGGLTYEHVKLVVLQAIEKLI